MFKKVPLFPTKILVPKDRKPPDPETVRALKVSMSEVGLLNPITVQSRGSWMHCYLVAGRHRLEAAIQLGWDAIDCIELPDLDEGADAAMKGKLAGIAENLHRREIDTIERGELIAEWDRLRSERKPLVAQFAPSTETRKDGRRKGPQHKPAGVRQTARDLNMPRDAVARSLKVASLTPEAKAKARDVGLASNQSALLKAAKEMDPAAQVAALERRSVEVGCKTTTEPATLRALRRAWHKAGKRTRASFLAERRLKNEITELRKPKPAPVSIDNNSGNVVPMHRPLTQDEAAAIDAETDQYAAADFDQTATDEDRARVFSECVRHMAEVKAKPEAVVSYLKERPTSVTAEYVAMLDTAFSHLSTIRSLLK